MMINKINSISHFGTFSDFKWDESKIQEFKRYNFIYGWNYSGKTTLSRLFRSLELKQKHQDYQNFEFEIKTDNINLTEKDIALNNLLIRVFNEEFIEENFRWNDNNHRISPILILGKETIKLKNDLQEKEKLKSEKEGEKKNKDDDKKRLENELQNALTNKASEIRNILGITNPREFDRPTLEDKLNKIRDNYKNLILIDNQEEQKLTAYRSPISYEVVSKVNIELKLANFVIRTNTILSKKISAQQVIEKLKNNPQLNNWVREGIDLHKDETQCQFCGNTLPEDLFERLNKHFSKEFDQLINEITSLQNEIQVYKNTLEKTQFPDKARFYIDFQKEYDEKLNEFQECLNNVINDLENLLNRLQEKRNKPFDELKQIISNELEQKFQNKLDEINGIIDKNNQKIRGLSEEKNKIKQELLNHYSAKAMEELEYFKKKEAIEQLVKDISQLQDEIEKYDKEIKQIKEQIARSNIGAEKINNYLKAFFADDHIQLKALDDGTYQLYRNNLIAKNLSTGERNIISLIYFITKLEESDFHKNKAIVFIDDPVSSLDSNHTFKAYGFLAEKVLDCKQVFITTHNFDFFNLLKDLIKGDPEGTPNKQNKNEKENYYLIKKISKLENEKQSTIEDLPNVLRKFKSEYNYLFSILKLFNDSSDKSNYELLYIMPNVARRFLESYLFQKYPDGRKFKEKCDTFFNDINPSDKTSTLKIIDEYSHEENPEHAFKFPDIQELEKCIKIILDLIKQKDQEHYDALCNSICNNR